MTQDVVVVNKCLTGIIISVRWKRRSGRVLGISLPHSAQGQYDMSIPVAPEDAQPGDLVFFHSTYKTNKYIPHGGIYAGEGVMFEAGGDGVKYTDLNTSYWKEHFVGFGRVTPSPLLTELFRDRFYAIIIGQKEVVIMTAAVTQRIVNRLQLLPDNTEPVIMNFIATIEPATQQVDVSKRIGIAEGEFEVPDDFDAGSDEIYKMLTETAL